MKPQVYESSRAQAALERRSPHSLEASGLPDFDKVAFAYQWMEYLSLGITLERVRFWALDAGWLNDRTSALVLGDGDGRFTARLLDRNVQVKVHAVDLSRRMLRLLQHRCRASCSRLSITCADARSFEPQPETDLVVTHFFLDCLEQHDVHLLLHRIVADLKPGALWIVSEFQVPPGWLHGPAWLLVRSLYLAFRILTGLRVTQLPDFANELRASGVCLIAEEQFLGGLLVSQVWQAAAS